jgi:hypothetical protein
LKNLAADPALTDLKQELRDRLENWIEESRDRGFEPLDPEHVEFFDRYRDNYRKQFTARHEALKENVRNAVEDSAKKRID